VRLLVPAAALASGRVEVRGDDHHYLFRVRRLPVGATVIVFDGEGAEADAVVERVDAERAELRVGAARREPAATPRLTVVQAVVKGDRMDWCVQKLVEVGVDRLVLVTTERCVVRLDAERAEARRARLQTIAAEAAKQARRATVPAVEWSTFDAALAGDGLRLVCHPQSSRSLADHLGTSAAAVTFLVGPEGGLTPAELDRAAAAGFEAVALGPTVLRAETAGVAAVAAFRLARASIHAGGGSTVGNH
jgi:16S rRNA (uracil1498-N3)-methyltransferase